VSCGVPAMIRPLRTDAFLRSSNFRHAVELRDCLPKCHKAIQGRTSRFAGFLLGIGTCVLLGRNEAGKSTAAQAGRIGVRVAFGVTKGLTACRSALTATGRAKDRDESRLGMFCRCTLAFLVMVGYAPDTNVETGCHDRPPVSAGQRFDFMTIDYETPLGIRTVRAS
jgi:hypothetical protein